MEQIPHALQNASTMTGNMPTILVFATSIQQLSDIKKIKPLLDKDKAILSWNVDMEDWEKILRVKGNGISGATIARMISVTGIEIRELE